MSDPLHTLARAIESVRDYVHDRLLGLGRPDARYEDYPFEEMAALLEPAEEDEMGGTRITAIRRSTGTWIHATREASNVAKTAIRSKWVCRFQKHGMDLVSESPTKKAALAGLAEYSVPTASYRLLNGWAPEDETPVEVQEQRVPRRKSGVRRKARKSRAKGRRTR